MGKGTAGKASVPDAEGEKSGFNGHSWVYNDRFGTCQVPESELPAGRLAGLDIEMAGRRWHSDIAAALWARTWDSYDSPRTLDGRAAGHDVEDWRKAAERMQTSSHADLEILMPVHNEAGSIEATIREIYLELSTRLKVGFIICEDGSKDNTQEILRRLAGELPLRLKLSEARKGYSRAISEGMQMLESDYLLCLDSDGQCDPKDFWAFWEARGHADVLVGWRVQRADTLTRRIFSRFFYLIYQAVFRTPLHDPSCSYVLIPRTVASRLAGEVDAMPQGFWWEFAARVHRRGYKIKELPVHHRLRAAGVTRVFHWRRMPGIFLQHVAAIFRVWAETRRRGIGVQIL